MSRNDIPLSQALEFDWDAQYIPSPSDLLTIRRSIETSRAALSEISRLRSHLETLQASESFHQKNVNRQLRHLWDSRILPRDVWREIFTWVILMSPEDPASPFTNAVPSLTLSHVCRDWHETASRMPFIWSKIIIKPEKQIPLGTINLLTLFVTRSIQVPLTLVTALTSEENTGKPEELDKIRRIIRIALSQSFRWYHIELTLPFSLWTSTAISFPIQAPLLEKAFLSCESGPDTRLSSWSQTVFTESSAPRLRHVKLHHLTTTQQAFKNFLPWSKLETLFILPPSDGVWRFGAAEAWIILQSCPHLTASNLIIDTHGDNTAPIGHVTAPSLLKFHYWALNGLILEHLTAPNLVEFKISQVTLTDGQVISSFIARSPQLKRLALNGPDVTFLAFEPHVSLEHVTIRVFHHGKMLELAGILPFLHLPSSVALPGLHTLRVELVCPLIYDDEPTDEGSATLQVYTGIVNLITARVNAATNLRRVEISIQNLTSAPEQVQTILRQLQVLDMDGLYVTLD
ncbi:hypothetical protein DL96DRAFT_1819011 [Flagelloscypha sp. PMI_526]|nr:hypothetical protein DL96DRAFT_1819011 [Flagelloscypha sp. PMI_526]